MVSSSNAATVSSSPSNMEQLMTTATPALVSGAFQAVMFNPFDRALYLRVQSRRRRFLDRRNFSKPFQGFANAAAYRTIVGASYIFWQDSCRIWIPRIAPSWLNEHDHPTLHALTIGVMAGTVNGIALNNLQAVKFRMWATSDSANVKGGGNFWKTAKHMYQTGGIRVFFRGCIVTVQRDVVFGVCYEGLRRSEGLSLLCSSATSYARRGASTAAVVDDPAGSERRHRLPRANDEVTMFFVNLIAAVAATAVSSPWNFVRSVAYGTPPHADSLPRPMIVRFLWTQASYAFKHGETYRKIRYHSTQCVPIGWHFRAAWRVINQRLNVGWGSLRVGLGMAAGQYIFGFVQRAMSTPVPERVPPAGFFVQTANSGKGS